jgi:fructosamine-3-kinase
VSGVRGDVARALGFANATALRWTPVSGGDINDAFRVDLSDGRRVFVKTNSRADAAMFAREAEGLAWLAEPAALRVPAVRAVGAAFLVLEHIERGARGRDFDERLGRGLAALHRAGASSVGWRDDNFIGTLPQDNGHEDDWPTFYARRRLAPQLERAARAGRATGAMQRGFARLYERLPELVGPAEPPARLHGDLWGGNCFADDGGSPVLIDPAVYGGHREMDLAMMQLFGGFSDRVLAAYDEALPLAPGWEERVPLYQLYPLMVHVNLFGGGYASSVERVLARY